MVMSIGIGALASLGLALPTGLAFGYGYGYGVRQGYHSYKPSKSPDITTLRTSPNPVTGGLGMGLASAEEFTNNQNPTVPNLKGASIPTVGQQAKETVVPTKETYSNKSFTYTKQQIYAKGAKAGMSKYEAWKAFHANKRPFSPANTTYKKNKGR
jgi:hypothetical protein